MPWTARRRRPLRAIPQGSKRKASRERESCASFTSHTRRMVQRVSIARGSFWLSKAFCACIFLTVASHRTIRPSITYSRDQRAGNLNPTISWWHALLAIGERRTARLRNFWMSKRRSSSSNARNHSDSAGAAFSRVRFLFSGLGTREWCIRGLVRCTCGRAPGLRCRRNHAR